VLYRLCFLISIFQDHFKRKKDFPRSKCFKDRCLNQTPASRSCFRCYYSNMALAIVKGCIILRTGLTFIVNLVLAKIRGQQHKGTPVAARSQLSPTNS